MIGVRDIGALRRANDIRLRGADGSVLPVEKVSARLASGLAEVYRRNLRLAASPPLICGFSASRGTTTSESVSVSVSGGTPPYAHSWSSPSQLTPTNPTGSFTAYRIPRNLLGTFTAVDTVTDAFGLSATISVQIEIERGSDGLDMN